MTPEAEAVQEELPIEIAIVDDAVINKDQAHDETKVEVKTESPSIQPTPDPLAELKAQNETIQKAKEESDRRAAEAERRASEERKRADTAEQQVQTEKANTVDHQYETITLGLESAIRAADAAEEAYVAAQESGDFKKSAKAQREMAKAEAERVRLAEAKNYLDDQRERVKTAPKTETRREAPSDPVEAYLANKAPAAQTWLRAHSDYVTDARKNFRLNAAHVVALDEDIAEGSPEYFARIEKYLGLSKADPQVQAKPRSQPAPVAPVGNGSGSINGGTSNGSGQVVKLSRGEANAATDGTVVWNADDPKGRYKKGDPIGTQEYARRKLQMQKDGHYDKMNYEQ